MSGQTPLDVESRTDASATVNVAASAKRPRPTHSCRAPMNQKDRVGATAGGDHYRVPIGYHGRSDNKSYRRRDGPGARVFAGRVALVGQPPGFCERAQPRAPTRATGSSGCRNSGRRSGRLMRLAGCGLTAPPRNFAVAPTRSACAAVGTCPGSGSEPVGLSSPDLLRRHSRPAAARAWRGHRCLRRCDLALKRSSPAGR